jgi:hypothetical protein
MTMATDELFEAERRLRRLAKRLAYHTEQITHEPTKDEFRCLIRELEMQATLLGAAARHTREQVVCGRTTDSPFPSSNGTEHS